MELFQLGEKKLVEKLCEILGNKVEDAACIKLNSDFLVISTDMIYEQTHVPEGMSYYQIGKLIVTVNFSDLAAMAAKPLAFLLAIGCSRNMKEENFLEIIRGVKDSCQKYGARFVGGDTKEAEKLTLTGTAIGLTERPVFRYKARPGDKIVVTGTLGDAALGLELLKKKRNKLKDYPYIKKRTFEPEPRVKEALLLGKLASSMTDISDSLAISLYDISKESNVGFEIFSEKIPISEEALELAKIIGVSPLEKALYGGGDYELLATIPKDKIDKLPLNEGFTIIGNVIEQRKIFLVSNGKKRILEKMGYEHFKR